MLKVYADQYIDLGEHIQNIRIVYGYQDDDLQPRGSAPLSEKDNDHVRDALNKVLRLCNELELPVSFELIKKRVDNLPQTEREFDLLISAVYAELRTKVFLFVPPNRAKFYDFYEVLGNDATMAFPKSYGELFEAANAIASGLFTASVFHSMRAAEIGVRVLGKELGVSFPNKPLDMAEWAQILDQSDAKIKAIGQKSRSEERDADQQFFSMAASQFRYFKDGWRVRVAHSRATYGEQSAIKIFDHTRDFFETLSERLEE